MYSQDVRNILDTCYKIYNIYEDILNAYVSDFYIENHWLRLPYAWRKFLHSQRMHEIADLFNVIEPDKNKLYPLSLLCLRQLIIRNSIPRKNNIPVKSVILQEKFMKAIWKNVKLKKRHEIEKMSQLCYESSLKTNCSFIVDVGSGLGHLSRMLAFGYDLKVCSFEADKSLSDIAPKLDTQLKKQVKSYGIHITHLNKRITYDISISEFLTLVVNAFQVEHQYNFKFGIVGLHPCGNLATTLLRLYTQCPNIVFINIASCCYMKLTLEPHVPKGFPLSSYCNIKNFQLTYMSCEIACHAIENYVEKLQTPAELNGLKIHAYRAGLEKILVSIDKEYKHISVANVKYTSNLSFKEYCDLALRKTDIVIDSDNVTYREISQTWQQVVYFYSVRLMLAPLVETIILYDRLLYVKESEHSECSLLPVFDCKISPRNHVLCATKN